MSLTLFENYHLRNETVSHPMLGQYQGHRHRQVPRSDPALENAIWEQLNNQELLTTSRPYGCWHRAYIMSVRGSRAAMSWHVYPSLVRLTVLVLTLRIHCVHQSSCAAMPCHVYLSLVRLTVRVLTSCLGIRCLLSLGKDPLTEPQQTQHVGPTLCKCYTHVLCLLVDSVSEDLHA